MKKIFITHMIIAALAMIIFMFTLMPSVHTEEAFAEAESVAFTVYYQDIDGNMLHEPQKFYGISGEKTHIDYKGISGYIPVVRTLIKTLSEDEDDNVFTFVYKKTNAFSADSSEEKSESDKETAEEKTQPAEADTKVDDKGSEKSEGEDITDKKMPLAQASTSVSGSDSTDVSNAIEEERDLDSKGPIAEPGMPMEKGDHILFMIILAQIAALIVIFLIWKHVKKQSGHAAAK